MTLDLDELGRIASAATPGPWERRVDATGAVIRLEPAAERGKAVIGYVTTQTLGAIVKDGAAHDGGRAFRNAAHIAAFNPAVCAALLARARDAERLEKALRFIDGYFHETGEDWRKALPDEVAALSKRREKARTNRYEAVLETFSDVVSQALSALNEGGPANG